MGKFRAALAAATVNLALVLPVAMASAHGLDQPEPYQTASIGQDASPQGDDGGSGITGPYATLITKYAKKYGVSPALADAVVRVESNFNPKARGSAGEVGLMQIKPSTARMMGYSGSVKGLFNPETNIAYGMKYLAMAQDLGDGTTCSTILKYNAGHGADHMNPVSKRYCGRVLSYLD